MAEHVIRTFKPRRRQLTPARAELFERLGPLWCLDEVGPVLDAMDVFDRSAPVVLEIGMGFGDTTTASALAEPDVDVIAVDVHTPGIVASLARIEIDNMTNLRLVHGDALIFLRRIAPGSLVGVRIYFPDPWPKIRHRHRRIVRPDVVARLVDCLVPGGWIDLATDIDDYAGQILAVCTAHPLLNGGQIERPATRLATRYERKGLAAGRTPIDLRFYKET